MRDGWQGEGLFLNARGGWNGGVADMSSDLATKRSGDFLVPGVAMELFAGESGKMEAWEMDEGWMDIFGMVGG
jgi:hypothetical protein